MDSNLKDDKKQTGAPQVGAKQARLAEASSKQAVPQKPASKIPLVDIPNIGPRILTEESVMGEKVNVKIDEKEGLNAPQKQLEDISGAGVSQKFLKMTQEKQTEGAENAGSDTLSLAKKRMDARLAMEGGERRKKREETDKLERMQKAEIEAEAQRKNRIEQERIEAEKQKALAVQRAREDALRASANISSELSQIKATGGIKNPVRTLKTDMASVIQQKNISSIGIAIQEDKKRRERIEIIETKKKTNWALLIVSLIFILGGAGFLGYAYFSNQTARQILGLTPTMPIGAQIVYSDRTIHIETDGIEPMQIANQIKNEVQNIDMSIGKIEDVVLIKTVTTGGKTTKQLLTAREFLEKIDTRAPDELIRMLTDEYELLVNSSVDNAGVIILKTKSQEQAFASVLSWEGGTIVRDLFALLTGKKPDASLYSKLFEDKTLKNQDVRVLKNEKGEDSLLWGFFNSDTIIFAGNPKAFNEAINRFHAPKTK